METEKDRLERGVKDLQESYNGLKNYSPADAEKILGVIESVKERLAALTRPAIKDGVLINFNGLIEKYNKDMIYGGNVRPLTIEELLPTLAQWVPGAVRWRYACRDWVILEGSAGLVMTDKIGAAYRIPAPPRNDWESVSGEV